VYKFWRMIWYDAARAKDIVDAVRLCEARWGDVLRSGDIIGVCWLIRIAYYLNDEYVALGVPDLDTHLVTTGANLALVICNIAEIIGLRNQEKS
jgi:hypothetical protein